MKKRMNTFFYLLVSILYVTPFLSAMELESSNSDAMIRTYELKFEHENFKLLQNFSNNSISIFNSRNIECCCIKNFIANQCELNFSTISGDDTSCFITVYNIPRDDKSFYPRVAVLFFDSESNSLFKVFDVETIPNNEEIVCTSVWMGRFLCNKICGIVCTQAASGQKYLDFFEV